MMYRNGFAIAVSLNGNTLRESEGKVYLPFQSEYELLLKNTHDVRAIASVHIDGMDAMGGKELIIPVGGSVALQRFCIDGNLSSGRRFKFVPANQAQDPTNSGNGKLRVTFWKEAPYYVYTNSSLRYFADSSGSYNPKLASMTYCSAGATVEGSKSNQGFVTTHDFNKNHVSTVLELLLLGNDVAVRNKDKVYCVSCGKRMHVSHKFCAGCGTAR